MKNAKKFYEQMTQPESGWSFKKFYDNQQSCRSVGYKGDFGCLIDLEKNKVEFWKWSQEYDIIYKLDYYSEEELIMASCTCDNCGVVQTSESDLVIGNINQKYCKECCNCD